MPLQGQKSLSTTTLVSTNNKLGKIGTSPFGPIDMHYMRRLAVRMQKQSVILQRLNDLRIYHFLAPSFFYIICIIVVFVAQIMIVVERTSLFYVCSGFWVAAIYAFCIVSLFILGKFENKNCSYF